MINITSNGNGVVFEGKNKLSVPLNSLILVIEKESDIVMFKSATDYGTILQDKWQNITINGNAVTKETIASEFDYVSNKETSGGGGGGSVDVIVTDTLPEVGSENVIYLIPSQNPTTSNIKDEYMFIQGKWELIGSSSFDLTDYITESELNSKGYITTTQADSKYQPKGNYITEIPTEYVTETELNAKGYITSIPTEYVTETELNSKGYATTSQLDSKLDKSKYDTDKPTFATKDELSLKANTSDLSDFVTKTSAESTYAKKSEIPSLEGYLTESDASTTYATKTELNGKVDDAEIADMATKTWVGEQGYLTSHQDISNLATKQELTSGLGTKQDKGDYALRSEIPDVSKFITNSVNNLVNYYKKSETYTQAEVNNLIGAITTISFEVVDVLPETGEDNKIYLIPNAEQAENNVKDEFIYVESKWEKIGSTSVDLSNYFNKDEINAKLELKLDKATYETDKGTFALKTEIPDVTNLATKEELNAKADITSVPTVQTGSLGNKNNYIYSGGNQTSDLEKNVVSRIENNEREKKLALNYYVWGETGWSSLIYLRNASSTKDGAMSAEDKVKLDSIDPSIILTETKIKTINGKSLIGGGDIVTQNVVIGVDGINTVINSDYTTNAIYIDNNTIENTIEPKAPGDEGDSLPIAYGNIYIENGRKLFKLYDKDNLSKTEASATYQPIGEYLTSIPSEYVTDTELNSKGYKKIDYKTQAEYDALPTKEQDVLYVITDADEAVIPDTSDMLTKTEASTTYALQTALQAALDRITALEQQIATINNQFTTINNSLDSINGEVVE